MNAARVATGALALLLAASPARAQDFAAPARGGPGPSALAFLERGLAPADAAVTLEAAAIRWFGLADLGTRTLAAAAGWRSLRAAAGISQTGDVETGWSALAVAAGAARSAGGVAVRAVARRDRRIDSPDSPLGAGVGVEAGGGAWIEAGAGLTLWAQAPQVWRGGVAVPLPRALEIGGAFEAGGLTAWLARAGPARGTGSGTRRAGLGVTAGPWSVWVEARDRPLRAGLGIEARARRMRAAAAFEGHPVLGETARISLGLVVAGGGR
jgi:hypothetical protein